jgi:hypothetical protein
MLCDRLLSSKCKIAAVTCHLQVSQFGTQVTEPTQDIPMKQAMDNTLI